MSSNNYVNSKEIMERIYTYNEVNRDQLILDCDNPKCWWKRKYWAKYGFFQTDKYESLSQALEKLLTKLRKNYYEIKGKDNE